ncbi:MAG TPA: Rieske (2Fe-2S) protein [Stellaceae bacterium]|jgi:nitrite reductase/ring-hydroxylating ferredoxin subunit
MDLPESVAAIGERIGGGGAIVPDPQLLTGADVFASERDRLFMRPWIAVDHVGRLDKAKHYFRFDAATRSILVTRAADGRLHALRNVCIHAGYPVCEAEEGAVERLICPYHGWEFTLEGRLVEPDLSARIDPARLRLASHPVCVRDGLIFVDLSAPASDDPAFAPIAAAPVPEWLAEAEIIERTRYTTERNWKIVLQLLKSSSHLVLDEPDDGTVTVFGPLSLMMTQPQQAALLRVIPKSAERTDIQLIRMAPRGAPCQPAAVDGVDRLSEGLRQAGNADAAAPLAELDREFFAWYWSLMSTG